MNILDYEADEFNKETWLKDMYDRQYKVYEKYKEIEGMPKEFKSIQTRETQKWMKDFINRINEEVAESYESIRNPETSVIIKDENGNEFDVHRSEELADALHFYLELLIITGHDAEWLKEKYANYEKRVYSDFIELNYWEVSYQLGMLGNCLKLKPWKQDEVLTDVNKVEDQLTNVFYALLNCFAANGNTEEDIYSLYTRKNKVNKFRQNSGY